MLFCSSLSSWMRNRFRHGAALLMSVVFVCAFASSARADFATLVMDAGSGRVLHEVNSDLPRYPASLTKMMTLYLLFEALDDGTMSLDDRLVVSSHAAQQPPTKLGLKPGQTITVENAILALVTKSANDMAAAVAEALAGTETQFAWAMTRKARELGMLQTSFANASGLPDAQQITTARDMAILALALLHDFPHYYHFFGTERFYYGHSVHPNHNRMLGSYQGLDGIKTGYTHASGFNLVASAQRDGRRLIGVVMGARSPANRAMIMSSLLDQAFDGTDVIEVRNGAPAPVYASAAPLPSRTVVSGRGSRRAVAQARSAGRAVAVKAASPATKRNAVASRSQRAQAVAVKARSRNSSVRNKASADLVAAKRTVNAPARKAAPPAVVAKKGKSEVAASANKPKARGRRAQADNTRSRAGAG